MENKADQKVEDGDRISNLPKDILYRILYFLSTREAAQTCVLSKSWRFLWTNRLTVSYRERSPLFNGPHRTRLFISHVINALQTNLHHHNHRIEEFDLVLTSSESISLLKKWIPMLKAIGVKELFLSICSKRRQSRPYIVLPSVVFQSKCLTSLDLCRCRLILQNITKVQFVRLKLLHLVNVNFTGEHIFKKIISSCPMITTIWLQECLGLKTIKLENKKLHKYLKHFTFINGRTYRSAECSIEIHVIPTLETINIVGSKVQFHGHKFDNLKKLSLEWAKFSSNSFDCSLAYEFPSLRRLDFASCYGWGQVDQLLCINAPKILYFRYVGRRRTIPSITFTPVMSRECRSDINLVFRVVPQSSFLKLSGLLQAVSQSEIFLSVYQDPVHNTGMNIERLDIIDSIVGGNNKAPVVVEQLGLNMGHLSSFPCFLNGLFSICRPRYIAQQKCVLGGESEEERDHKELTEFLCKFLMKRSACSEFRRQEDLEELKIESFDTSREQWQPTTMSECGALPESDCIRFRLKWSDDEHEPSSKRRKLE